ncbi:MAG: hypothetical protein KQH63_13905 [Desulfobulbaceae bacterium]|nr:hypothetical protein [Desulfobulbaceae bacterium]
MNSIKTLSLVFFSLFLTACCPPTSLHPLSPPEDAQYDKRLEGAWIHKSEGGDIAYLHVGKAKGNFTKAISTEIQNEGELDFTVFTMFPTIIDGNHYMNVKAEEVVDDLPADKAGYIFVRYELTGKDNLTVYYMDEDEFTKGIQAGKVKGEISYRNRIVPEQDDKEKKAHDRKVIDCVRITDTSKNIQNFIRNSSIQALFPEELQLTRDRVE